jgi:hypothetical protein
MGRASVTAWVWPGRVAASLVLLLGVLVFTSAIETTSPLLFALAALAIGGASLFIFGIERPTHPFAPWARALGWVMMAGFSLVPTSLLFVPFVVVLVALPCVSPARLTPRPGTGASASHDPGPT